MSSIFAYQSAEVDWCEGNFEHSEYIAEYYNTISNVSFFVLAPFLLWMNSSYMQFRPNPVKGLFVAQLCIGAFSMYFHMTLSFAGQLLDELSILWGVSLCYAFWFPTRHFPSFIKNRDQFMVLVGLVSGCSTLLSFLRPAWNAYALNCVALHVLYLLGLELHRSPDERVHHVAALLLAWWLISIGCWLTDKFLCGFCQKISFCYFHSFWHVFINVALYYCATLVIYFDLLLEGPPGTPFARPHLAYWPSESSPCALPYVTTIIHKQC
ncbi:alkaline ceramidase 1 [Anolis carolinensis]|uniref:alkaline ceramidase 1 n=1 Tax=Anolis carolinensis TaxID=28377 RepID=UPI002F2B827C